MLPVPHKLTIDPAYRPFLDLTEAVLLTSAEIAKHYRYSVQHVHNMRRLGTGPAYVQLASGAVRYRHSEVLAWELAGQSGPVTPDRISLALATAPGMKPDQRMRLETHLNRMLFPRK